MKLLAIKIGFLGIFFTRAQVVVHGTVVQGSPQRRRRSPTIQTLGGKVLGEYRRTLGTVQSLDSLWTVQSWDSAVLGQCSLRTVQSWDSGLGTVVLGQRSWDSTVLGQWSWDGTVLGQWSWDSAVLGQ